MKLLWLLGEIPYPVTSGGKRAMSNHLQLVRDLTDWQVVVVALDADGDRLDGEWPLPAERFAIHRVPRHRLRMRSVAGLLHGLVSFLISPDPRPVQVRKAPRAADLIASLLADGGFSAVVFEHIAAVGMVPARLPVGIPLIHVSQNVESKVAADQWRSLPWSAPLKAVLWIEARKMARCERRMMARVDGTICISGDDAAVLGPWSPAPVLAWTEPYWPHPQRWQGAGSRDLLFVGSIRYFPNAEAVRWLVELLMPALGRIDPQARLRLAGTSADELKQLCQRSWGANVSPLGFVSEEEKHRLHQTCGLFLCPIVSGSGVKMKALDAMAYGMPLLCTPECLAGVTEGDDTRALGRLAWKDPDASAALVAGLLADPAGSTRLAERCATVLASRNTRARMFVDFIAGIAGTPR
jgi:hypothetical protein